jgi:hypothetical protein
LRLTFTLLEQKVISHCHQYTASLADAFWLTTINFHLDIPKSDNLYIYTDKKKKLPLCLSGDIVLFKKIKMSNELLVHIFGRTIMCPIKQILTRFAGETS